MTILALEFSSARRSVALAREGRVLAEAADESGGRGTAAFAMIEQVLAEAGVARAAVEVLAVGLGPGSYTGIRAAIAIAQGWQLATGAKLRGVSSAEAIAAQARAENHRGAVDVVIDAQRGEFYLAVWELSDAGCREISPLKIVLGSEIAARQAGGNVCLGPATDKIIYPSAAMIAQLAAAKTEFVAANDLTPIYLRETTFVKAPPHRLWHS